MSAILQSVAQNDHHVLDIFKRHVKAFMSGDLDAVLRDFNKYSVVITPDGVFEGLEQIRVLYSRLLEEFGVIDRGDSPGINIDMLHFQGDMLFITWHAESKNHIFPFGTDTFFANGETFDRQTISYGELEVKP